MCHLEQEFVRATMPFSHVLPLHLVFHCSKVGLKSFRCIVLGELALEPCAFTQALQTPSSKTAARQIAACLLRVDVLLRLWTYS